MDKEKPSFVKKFDELIYYCKGIFSEALRYPVYLQWDPIFFHCFVVISCKYERKIDVVLKREGVQKVKLLEYKS